MPRRTKSRTGYPKKKVGGKRRKIGSSKMSTLKKEVQKIYRAAITDRPPKHIIYSDSSVTGGVTTVNGTIVQNNAPFIQYLGLISRGTTVQGRLADIIHTTKFFARLQVKFGTAMSGSYTLGWMLCVQKQPSGTALTATQFGTDYFGDTTPTPRYNLPNINNRDVQRKYQILRRGFIYNKATISGQIDTSYGTINWFSKRHIETSYTLGNAGTIADIDTGAIFLYLYTDSAIGTNGLQVYLEGHQYFRDQV
nr:MAG: capsid protein [Cressdnaviricota sp.]